MTRSHYCASSSWFPWPQPLPLLPTHHHYHDHCHEVFTLPHRFLPESAGMTRFWQILAEWNLGEGPANIGIPGTLYSAGIEPFQNWDWNGSLEWTGTVEYALAHTRISYLISSLYMFGSIRIDTVCRFMTHHHRCTHSTFISSDRPYPSGDESGLNTTTTTKHTITKHISLSFQYKNYGISGTRQLSRTYNPT